MRAIGSLERPADRLRDTPAARPSATMTARPSTSYARVVELRVKRDRQVRRNRPRRRRPDQHRDVAARERRHARGRDRAALSGVERELDVDRRRRVVRVLDLRFGQRRAAVDAPVDRLLALVDEPLLDELAERARDVRLVPRSSSSGSGASQSPKTISRLNSRGHDVDEPLGVRAAGAADVGDRHVALLRSELAIDLQLDRQAVAVVARRRTARRSRPSSAT